MGKKGEKHTMTPAFEWSLAPQSCKCVVCEKRGRLCHVIEGIGDICQKCFIAHKKCKITGCDAHAVKNTGGLCREHYIDDKPINLEDHCGLRSGILADAIDWRVRQY